MYISSNQMMVIKQEHTAFLQHILLRNVAEGGGKNKQTNYATLFYRCGMRRNHHVLVIGGENIELIQTMAKMVGWRGQITVLDNRDWVCQALERHAADGLFSAYKPFIGGHPTFDERAHHSKFVPVRFQAARYAEGRLPFDDDHFDLLWVESLPEGLGEPQFDQMICELERIAKN